MKYKMVAGRRICEEGSVVIDGMRHYVKCGYVYCALQLNHMAWNVTEAQEICATCRELIEADTGQLELFE
jgi:hypothetical protein